MNEDMHPSDRNKDALAKQIAHASPGALATSPAKFSFKTWWIILKRIYVMNDFHNLPLLSAGVAFFAFLAFVPLIAVIVLLYGLIGDPATVTASIAQAEDILPAAVLDILREQLLSVVNTSGTAKGFGLAFALMVSFYGAMRAANAMMKALNIIYEEHESRNYFVTTGLCALITLGMAFVAIVGLMSVSIFTYVSNFLQGYFGDYVVLMMKIATWVSAAIFVSIAFGLFFRFAPDRRQAQWKWLSLGSFIATLLWLFITIGFGYYVTNMSNYNATYGSLSAVIIFLMWLFLSAYSVLIGAEVNAETERQTFHDSTIGKDRPLGMRGAVMADTILVDAANKKILEKKQRRKADRLARKVSKL